MRRLLLDIRDNPGGPLDQAIKVVERIPAARQDDRLHARARSRIRIRTTARTEDGEFTDIPIVMLANRNSASASEIVTGALQDHDRAYVVGETTFGKALVQSVYRISGGAGLALTTAHYYTPSGRLIQRPWDATFDEYLSYTMRDQDANKRAQPERSEAHRRRAVRLQRRRHRARQVPRGAARRIQPDAIRPHRCIRAQEFATYAAKFTARRRHAHHRSTPTGRKTCRAQLRRSTTRWWPDFREQLKTDRVKIDEDAFQKDLTFIKAMMRFGIDRSACSAWPRPSGTCSRSIRRRSVALTMFGEAQKLAGLARGERPSRALVGSRVGSARLRATARN